MIAPQWSDSAPDARRRLTVLVLVLCAPTFAISLLGATRLFCANPGLTAGPSQQVPTSSARIKSRKDDSEMILIPAGTFIYGTTQKEIRRILKLLNAGMANIFETELPKTSKDLGSFYID